MGVPLRKRSLGKHGRRSVTGGETEAQQVRKGAAGVPEEFEAVSGVLIC